VSLPVIVNGTPTTLPAIHAAGTLVVEDKKARETSKSPTDKPTPTELFILDDPRNPLLLLYKMDVNNFRVQVTAIKFPMDKPITKIEDELLKTKKAVVYGIYFDYNSDQIKKESEPVLREIAAAMNNNPDWKLTVDGHTDSIGGDAYNLDLSKRRAAAVKQALVDRFQIAGDRLLTDGFGMRRPVDRNDTLEGRARNRRVELSRE
jgi:outer membrane protein OmpA-like peptidoglycan-associated protein